MRRRRLTRPNALRHGLFAICLGAFAWATGAKAQTASQITPRSLAPPVQQGLGAGMAIPGDGGLAPPPGAEKLFVTIRGVAIQGGFPGLEQAERVLVARLSGNRVSAAGIFEAARALEQAYAQAGYVLARVVLPPQKLVDGGTVNVRVIDGAIERIDTKALSASIRDRVAAVLAPLVGRHGLTLAEIERRALLAADTPGLILRSTLAPGSTTGATVLTIDGRYQPVSGSIAADNSLARALGRYQIGTGVNFNGALGFGELVYLRANGDPNFGPNGFFADDPRNRLLSAGFILPVGVDGLTFNAEATQAKTDPAAADGFASSDVFERLSLRLRYPWLRRRDANFATEIAFDAQDERSDFLAGGLSAPLFEDRLRILRFTGAGDYLTPWGGAFNGRVTSSFGLDALGAREATPLLLLSREGADAAFSKIEASIGYSQPLMDHLAANVSVRGQSSLGQAMARSEQIGIAGPDALSAFDTGTLQGDSGVVGRGELSAPFALPTFAGAGVVAAPYAFGAVGALFLQHPTILEPARMTAGAYGAGLRFGGSAAGTLANGSLTLEFARQARSDGAPVGNRFTLVSAVTF